jgi:hypothetical protein
MRLPNFIFVSLILAAATLCAAQNNGNGNGNGNAYGKNKEQGSKQGTYTVKLVGQYSGDGTSTIQYPNRGQGLARGRGALSSNSISITATIKAPSGATGTVSFPLMRLVDDRFSGTANFAGTALTIYGRIDMPANTDADQTAAQKITGRISALLTDSSGKGARLVAVENESSRKLVSVP